LQGIQAVSCSPKLRIDLRPERENFTPKGDRLPTTPALYAQFQPGGNVPDHAKTLVEQLPGFRAGVGRDEDPYLTRLGWWDSIAAKNDHGWSNEDHDAAVTRFLEVADPNVIVLQEVVVETPYPKYVAHRKLQGKRTLEHVFNDIRATYEIAGFDVEQASAFERQNQNDPKVLEFLSTLGAPVAEESDELVAA
jgi:hypothetical protein